MKLTGLWKNTSQKGVTHLSGKFGRNTKLLVFSNTNKTNEKAPDYSLCIAPQNREQGSILTVTGLWKATGVTIEGQQAIASGLCGMCEFYIIANPQKTKETDPDFHLCITQVEQGQRPSAVDKKDDEIPF